MSSGQKQCEMDDEDRAWEERKKKLAEMDPGELLHTISRIKEELYYLKPGELSITRTQHIRLEAIERLLRKLP